MTLLQHPSGYAEPCVTIRRWQMFSTQGNLVACALLGVFEVFHHSRLRARASQGEDRGDIDLLQHHTNKQLIDRINHIASDKTVREAIKLLEAKGFITIEKNPSKNKAFDRTRYFLFHPEVAQLEIDRYLLSINPSPSHSVDLPNGLGNFDSPSGKSTECSLYIKRSREVSLRESEPENFSEPEPETKPSPVKESPIAATNPTTAQEKTTPQPPSAPPTLNAQILATYAKFRPEGWADAPKRIGSLESSFMRVIRDLENPSEILERIELALKFAADDWALKQKTGSIEDLFSFRKLIEWSDKGRKKFGESKPVVTQEELDRRQAALAKQNRIAQAKNEAKLDWIRIHYPDDRRWGEPHRPGH